MLGKRWNNQIGFSSGKPFGKTGCRILLLIGGLFSFFFLIAFGKVRAGGASRTVLHDADEAQITRLRRQATDGDPERQLKMGVMCAAGVGGRPDYQSAIFWLRRAAEQGEPNAQMLSAMMCLEGIGTRRSYMEAARWARLSAHHGNVPAQLLMGAFLEDGVGVRRDPERAIYWYQYAAQHPVEIGARYRIGMLYLEGQGVAKDIGKGLQYLNEAAEKGDAHAAFQLGMISYDGRLLDRDYEKAFDCYMKAAEKRFPEKGEGAPEVLFGADAVPGEVYTRTVAQIMKRNPNVVRDACFYLGLMYETGRGVEQDMDQSKSWYESAAAAGDEIAAQRLVFLREHASDPV